MASAVRGRSGGSDTWLWFQWQSSPSPPSSRTRRLLTTANPTPRGFVIFLLISLFSLSISESVYSFQQSASSSSLASNNTGSILNITTTSSNISETTTIIANKENDKVVVAVEEEDEEEEEKELSNSNKTTIKPTTFLSSDEFVDFTETPTLLFDAIANDNATKTILNNTLNIDSRNTTILSDEPSSQLNKNVSTTTTTTTELETTTTTTTVPPEIREATTASPTTTTTKTPSNNGSNTSLVPEREEEEEEEEDLDLESKKLSGSNATEKEATTTTTGGESTPSEMSDQPVQFEAPQNISQYMDYIERLFHDLRHQITDLFEPHIPQLIRTSQSVELSSSCSFDMLRMALALRQFEPWALKMIDSSGKVPEGIFEGSFTALGSYDECLNVVFEHSQSNADAGNGEESATTTTSDDVASNQQSSAATRGKYCLVTVSPFLPPKPPTDSVERMFQDEANRRNYTKDDQFSRLSPMFYYMKFRIGVCIPSTCEQFDMNSIATALSKNLRLNITIPDCRVKQFKSSPLTRQQFICALLITTIFGLIFCATLFDCFKQKSLQLKVKEMLIIAVSKEQQNVIIKRQQLEQTNSENLVIKMDLFKSNEQQQQQQQQQQQEGQFDYNENNNNNNEVELFLNQLYKHWTWMSFSLMTNFKLYFKNYSTFQQQQRRQSNNQIIKCLNGIRVLSLCWVIIANSYLTLDPRATKRLTKTREAPKDFLFQIIVQASLAIETFFFLSGLLMSLSVSRKLNNCLLFEEQNEQDENQDKTKRKCEEGERKSSIFQWLSLYIHRYVRLTPATMLIIALTMYAYPYGDGPIWFEATKNSHESCKKNWWRHLLHIANYIDTRQMCFIHYWYISADMQLFLFAPILLFLIKKYKYLGYTLIGLIGSSSIFSVFYTTYERNLPPTLLFYSSDPESRREFGNTIMTKPLTHALPYIVGMLVGQWLASTTTTTTIRGKEERHNRSEFDQLSKFKRIFASFAIAIALGEIFLPYKWNNSHLPTRLMASIYASLFRLAWSLVLAYVVISCAHLPNSKCDNNNYIQSSCKSCKKRLRTTATTIRAMDSGSSGSGIGFATNSDFNQSNEHMNEGQQEQKLYINCFCTSGGNLINQLLSLNIFTHLSKLSFVAYLIHLPLMSVFIGQTRGLFAFSHTLVIHLAISYLVLTFVLSFLLVHLIEFPFITFEHFLFKKGQKFNNNPNQNNKKNDNNNENVREQYMMKFSGFHLKSTQSKASYNLAISNNHGQNNIIN